MVVLYERPKLSNGSLFANFQIIDIFCQYAYAYKRNVLEMRRKVLISPTRSSHLKFSTQRVLSKKHYPVFMM